MGRRPLQKGEKENEGSVRRLDDNFYYYNELCRASDCYISVGVNVTPTLEHLESTRVSYESKFNFIKIMTDVCGFWNITNNDIS